jgi:hypothetical protein
MIVKAIEIRDKGTFIPAMAIKMVPLFVPELGAHAASERDQSERERYLLYRAGYGFEDPCVVLCRMDANGGSRNASYDPYGWGDRTFKVAHDYIIEHFDELESGAVVDVEFLLSETKEPKKSERVS